MEKADILEMTVQFLKGANTRKRMQEGKANKLTSVPSFVRWSVVRGNFCLFLFLVLYRLPNVIWVYHVFDFN